MDPFLAGLLVAALYCAVGACLVAAVARDGEPLGLFVTVLAWPAVLGVGLLCVAAMWLWDAWERRKR